MRVLNANTGQSEQGFFTDRPEPLTYQLTPKSLLTAPIVATVGAYGFRGAMRSQLAAIQQYFAERQG